MQQFGLAGLRVTPARLHTTRLVVTKVAAGGDFPIGVLCRQPDLEVIGPARGKTEVPCTQCDFPVGENLNGQLKRVSTDNHTDLARLISAVENYPEENKKWIAKLKEEVADSSTPVLGITGTGGAGKSSLVDELVLRYLRTYPDKNLGIISVDPSKRKTGGALLGDRIRMNAIASDRDPCSTAMLQSRPGPPLYANGSEKPWSHRLFSSPALPCPM